MEAQEAREALAAVVDSAQPLWMRPGDQIFSDGRSLLQHLAGVDALINVLKLTRLALLRHERELGTSWGEISDATGTHASTWRSRHNQEVTGV